MRPFNAYFFNSNINHTFIKHFSKMKQSTKDTIVVTIIILICLFAENFIKF